MEHFIVNIHMYEVYIILDPKRKGKFCFGDYCFMYKPIYVGKGSVKNSRIFKKKNKAVENIIESRRLVGLEPIYISLFSTKCEQLALEKEIELIRAVGRRQFGGFLFNFTDGGDGLSGYVYTEQQLLARSKRMKNYFSKMTTEEKKLHGAKSLAKRKNENVLLGSIKQSITKRNKPKHDKIKIENARRKKWEISMKNRTIEQIAETSIKCKLAAAKQRKVFFTIFLVDQHKEMCLSRADLHTYGISYITINKIINRKNYDKEYVSKSGTKYKLINSFYKSPSSDLKVSLNR